MARSRRTEPVALRLLRRLGELDYAAVHSLRPADRAVFHTFGQYRSVVFHNVLSHRPRRRSQSWGPRSNCLSAPLAKVARSSFTTSCQTDCADSYDLRPYRPRRLSHPWPTARPPFTISSLAVRPSITTFGHTERPSFITSGTLFKPSFTAFGHIRRPSFAAFGHMRRRSFTAISHTHW